MSAKCKAVVENKWFHQRHYPGTTHHPCPFNAKRDGYCFRHHPADRARVLECRRVKLEAQLAAVNAELAVIGPSEGAENPS